MSEPGFDFTDDRVMDAGCPSGARELACPWGDEEIFDQALGLVADHHRALGAMIGRVAAVPTRDELRRSPLGQDLRLLADAGRGAAAPEETRAAAAHVEETLLRPLAADDYAVPDWFGASALGRLLARAKRAALGPDGLLAPAEAAARLGVREAEIVGWLADGSLPSVADETGAPLVSRAAVEGRQLVARALAEPASGSAASRPTDELVRVELRRAS